jgi:hypothetical protein
VRLLGVLLTVGIALGLSAYVADRVGGEQRAALPAGPHAAAVPQPAIPAARASACAADTAVLGTAEEAYKALHGRYADVPTIVAAGVLRSAPAVTVTVAPDGQTYAIGGC